MTETCYEYNTITKAGRTDLATTHPELAKEWDYEKNYPLTPQDLSAGSRRKTWWLCEKGHSWQAVTGSRSKGFGCPVCAGKQIIPGYNDFASRYPAIAAQWHPGKNEALRPESCAPASNRRVWWLCPAGHEYQAAISARTVNGSNCPYCAGKKVLAGFNDLASNEPELAKQWHPSLNGTTTPDMVTTGSKRKVWWQCEEGHVWKTAVYSRTGTQKSGCPVCSGRRKEVYQEKYASLAAQLTAEALSD